MTKAPTALAAAAGSAALLAGVLAAAPAHAAPAPAASPVASCKAVYKLNGAWEGKGKGRNGKKTENFTSSVRVYNTSDAPIDGWTLSFTFTGAKPKVTKVYAGTFKQSGKKVTVASAPFSAQILPGRSVLVGLSAEGTSSPVAAVSLSGTDCPATASGGGGKAGIAAALDSHLKTQAAAGGVSGKAQEWLQNKVRSLKRAEERGALNAQILRIRGFIKVLNRPDAQPFLTPEGKAALMGAAKSSLDSLL